MKVLGDDPNEFRAFQQLAVYFAGHPLLGDALSALRALTDDEFAKVASEPYSFLEKYDIAISRSVGVKFERYNPSCVTLLFLGYSIRIC